MESGVWYITNNLSKSRTTHSIEWEWVYFLNTHELKIEGFFTLNHDTKQFIWQISLRVSDLIYWDNSEILIFSSWFSYTPIWKNKQSLPSYCKDVWYIKSNTSLTIQEEKFLRIFSKMTPNEKKMNQSRYNNIQNTIERNIIEENEKIKSLLNDEKWYWWELDFF